MGMEFDQVSEWLILEPRLTLSKPLSNDGWVLQEEPEDDKEKLLCDLGNMFPNPELVYK